MSSLSAKVDLLKLDGATIQTSPTTGHKCLIIDCEAAHLFVGRDDKAVYLDLNVWQNQSVDAYGNSHSIKQGLTKEFREQLGPEGIKQRPYIGTAKTFGAATQTPPNATGSAFPSNNGLAF